MPDLSVVAFQCQAVHNQCNSWSVLIGTLLAWGWSQGRQGMFGSLFRATEKLIGSCKQYGPLYVRWRRGLRGPRASSGTPGCLADARRLCNKLTSLQIKSVSTDEPHHPWTNHGVVKLRRVAWAYHTDTMLQVLECLVDDAICNCWEKNISNKKTLQFVISVFLRR